MRLLDSNILIYASQPGNEFLLPFVVAPDSRVSAISIPEVLGFTRLAPEDEQLFKDWFARLHLEEVSRAVLDRAAEFRQDRRMTLGDSIIAATALLLGAELVTRNVDDFKHIAGLRVTNPFP